MAALHERSLCWSGHSDRVDYKSLIAPHVLNSDSLPKLARVSAACMKHSSVHSFMVSSGSAPPYVAFFGAILAKPEAPSRQRPLDPKA